MKKRIQRRLCIFLLIFCGIACSSCRHKQPSYNEMRDQVVNSMENAIEITMAADGEALEPDDYPGMFLGIEITPENLPLFPYTKEEFFQVDQEPELGGISIAYCTATDPVIVIPENIGGKKVVAINTAAFAESNYEAVVLPDSVVTVRNAAFQRCNRLKYVHFGSGVKIIEWMAFNFCPNLRRVQIPPGCKTLNGCVFYMCDRLRQIEIPDTVTEISPEFLSYETCKKVRIYTNAGSRVEQLLSGSGIPVIHLTEEDMEEEMASFNPEQMVLGAEELAEEKNGNPAG